MRHRELDPSGADALRPARGAAAQVHAGLGPAADLDLLPGEMHARAERFADRLLGGEAPRVVLRRVRLRVAVDALRLGEAALLEPVAVPLERTPDPRDLDQVDADPHRFRSSQSGTCASEETMASGWTLERSTSSGRNFPVRTRIVRMPWFAAPITSPSRSSPTIHVRAGSASSAARAASKYAVLGLPSTVASTPAAYSSPATNAPASSRGPLAVCHHLFLCRQY